MEKHIYKTTGTRSVEFVGEKIDWDKPRPITIQLLTDGKYVSVRWKGPTPEPNQVLMALTRIPMDDELRKKVVEVRKRVKDKKERTGTHRFLCRFNSLTVQPNGRIGGVLHKRFFHEELVALLEAASAAS